MSDATKLAQRITPGPWTLQALPAKPGYPNWIPHCIRSGPSNVHIATVGNVDRYYEGDAQTANAELIALAPSLLAQRDALLAALQGALNQLDSLEAGAAGLPAPSSTLAYKQARAAIALAGGGL